MAKVKGKQELCRSDLKYFKSFQGIGEHSLHERYQALASIIERNIDGDYRHFLAQPVEDSISSDSRIITWYSIPYSDIIPQRLLNLQGEDFEKYNKIKTETVNHYKNVIVSLKQKGETDNAKYLELALKFIDDKFIYCFADKVVLGVWGMELKENINEASGVYVKDVFIPPELPVITDDVPEVPEPLVITDDVPEVHTVTFNSGDGGDIDGEQVIQKEHDSFISEPDIPKITPKEGYEFTGWDKKPDDYQVSGDTEFTAQYRPIPLPLVIPSILPWYKRFWLWLTGKGCLKWLLWLLLFLLLLLLFWWLFRCCSRNHSAPIPSPIGEKPWIDEDPRVGGGGIYDPGHPYTPTPTPPDYGDVLPPQQGVLPPIEDNPEIIPGNPSIIANRLNILLENEDKSIMDLAKDFKIKYPDDKYKVIYYDNVVKRMQIEIPKEEREQLKKEIPPKFAPEYELFVFDEALFEGSYTPNDPAFADRDKTWYLTAIKAPQAWDITRGSEKITVAIVDNGFNLKHPELSSKVVMPYNVWKHSTEIFPQQVDHGTHVAGTALAIADNGKGICGIAPNCAFMPIQIADARGLMTTTSVLDGILYALYQGADVVNVSLGGQFTGLDQFPESVQRDLIQNHFKEEERLWREIMRIAANHNSTIVVAAGNDNVLAGIDALQRPELFITVSAVDKNSQSYGKADFSNYGNYSTISAPGVGIYSSIGKNDYATMDGTSMAAPIVTGAIALMKSLNDSLTTKQIICILQSTGLETQGNIGKLIQLDKALEKVKSGDIIDCTPPPSTGDIQVLLSWNNYNDLDLAVIDPYGNPVWFKNKRVPSGGFLEIDMNVEANDSQKPIENIFWQKGTAPKGTYEVYLWLYKQHININETPYKITCKYGDKTEEFAGKIKLEDGQIQICTFTFGNVNNPQNPNNPNPPSSDNQDNLRKKRDELQQQIDEIDRQLHNSKNNVNSIK